MERGSWSEPTQDLDVVETGGFELVSLMKLDLLLHGETTNHPTTNHADRQRVNGGREPLTVEPTLPPPSRQIVDGGVNVDMTIPVDLAQLDPNRQPVDRGDETVVAERGDHGIDERGGDEHVEVSVGAGSVSDESVDTPSSGNDRFDALLGHHVEHPQHVALAGGHRTSLAYRSGGWQ